jgi:hypothetical protein
LAFFSARSSVVVRSFACFATGLRFALCQVESSFRYDQAACLFGDVLLLFGEIN